MPLWTLPTSTASDALAQVSATITDAGTLQVLIFAVAIPLTFYIIHQVIGLFPKSRGSRRT